jgi:hypothetical protein
MAEIFHLHCRQCGDAMKKSPLPYCAPCNIDLCYRAMPLLLGMMLTGHIKLAPSEPGATINGQTQWQPYDHLRYILD